MEKEEKALIYIIEDHQVIANGVKQYFPSLAPLS